MLTRDQAIDAYRRTKDWESRQSAILRETILVPEFGGCGCRMHNCLVNFESGRGEGVTYLEHKRQAKLAKYYNWRQRQIWDTGTRLCNAFAKYF